MNMHKNARPTPRGRERIVMAAECSSLAATTPMTQMRDQCHVMARHYLMLAEAHGRKARPSLQRERLKGQKFKFGNRPR